MFNKIYRDYHSQVHKVFDYVPIISMGSSVVHIIKILKKHLQRKIDTPSKSILKQKKIEYYSKKQLTHLSRAILGLIPIIGNITMLVYDKLLKKIDLPKKSVKIVIPKKPTDSSVKLKEEIVGLKNSLEEMHHQKTHALNSLNHVESLIAAKQRLNNLFETFNCSNFEKEQSQTLLGALYSLQSQIYDELEKRVGYVELKSLVELIDENVFLKLRLRETALGEDYSIESLKIDNTIEESSHLLNIYKKALTKSYLSCDQKTTINNHIKILEYRLYEMESLKKDLADIIVI